ncbi:MAG: hypothetical protein ACLFWG_09310 [Longimicrobiales bacterium]
MNGLFEILIILAIFLLPALEGMIKKRKRESAGEAESGPGRAEADSGEEAGRSSREEGVPGSRGDRAAGPAAGGASQQTGERSEDRSAEELLPDDLWAILTGQERPKKAPDAPEEPSTTSSASEGGKIAGGEAIDAAPGGADRGGVRSGEASGVPASQDSSTTREPSYGYEVGSYGAPGASVRRRSRASQLQRIRTGRMARRGADTGARGGGLHPFFEGLNRTELRRAVVLQEVLGPPLGLRDEKALGPPPGL